MKSTLSTLARLVTAAAVATLAGAQTEVWRDDFETAGVPDPQWWGFDQGGGGWGNNELQTYTTQNARVKDGTLQITADRDGEAFTSARINTQDKVEVLYGTIEARINVPNVTGGLWPAFWTLGSNFPVVPWPECGEIDIMEVGQGGAGPQINNRVVSAAHWLHQNEQGIDETASFPGYYDNSELLNADYYIYSLEWTPDFLTTRINGEKIWEMKITLGNCTDCCTHCDELHEPHFIVLNLAVGGGFTVGNHSSCGYSSSNYGGGCPTPSAADIGAGFPAIMSVDWIRIVDYGITEIYLNSASPTKQPNAAPTNAPIPVPTTKAPTDSPKIVVVNADLPTSAPTFEDDDYYDDKWQITGTGSGKSGKGGKSKSSKGSKYRDDEIATICAAQVSSSGSSKGKSSKSGKSMSMSNKSRKLKSSKGKSSKGKSSKYLDVDCTAYEASLRTASALSSGAVAPTTSIVWMATLVLAPVALLLV
uniref:GH16 domain-containing protein n=1 Tax=Amphora coffeiformis TaxID=265554 RepID=A0A7S3P5R7_9STRA|mmetsp:Transcript_5647/g.10968  ORF Transcript_5647/g.10968 Transcript_5647/m.10968 type:complete len:477 (-) Transcript_5647:673-2103(-)|eukprot:scaffold1992_cov187-Amphora_coffeaeformis.AAC.29